jgi:branched chain amino acid efflux pump
MWIIVIAVGLVTIVIKGAGPLLLGGRSLPRAILPVLRLLPPALFAGLIVSQTFTHGRALTMDARAAGLLAAIGAVAFRAHPALVLLIACVTTAAVRMVWQ